MKHALVILTVVAVSLSGAKKKNKPPDVQIVETSARRSEGIVKVDGRIRNTGEKPLRGLILLFDFMAPGSLVITTQKSSIDEEVLAPGNESVFHVELTDPVRAVKYRLNAVDQAGRDLTVSNGGPFVIE